MLNVQQSLSFMSLITATNTPLFSHKYFPKYLRGKKEKKNNTVKSRQSYFLKYKPFKI